MAATRVHLSKGKKTRKRETNLLALCEQEFFLSFGRRWSGAWRAILSSDARVVRERKAAKALLDEARRWTVKVERLIESSRLADDEAGDAFLPELAQLLEALRERDVSGDIDPPWRHEDRSRSDRGRLARQIARNWPDQHSARAFAVVSLLVGNRPRELAIDARPEVVLIAETDAMRKAARRAGLVLGRRHRSRL